jgi:hypothetical protein
MGLGGVGGWQPQWTEQTAGCFDRLHGAASAATAAAAILAALSFALCLFFSSLHTTAIRRRSSLLWAKGVAHYVTGIYLPLSLCLHLFLSLFVAFSSCRMLITSYRGFLILVSSWWAGGGGAVFCFGFVFWLFCFNPRLRTSCCFWFLFFCFLPHYLPSTTHRYRGVLGGGGRRGRVLCVKMCMKVVFVVVGLVIESWRICNFARGLSIVTAGMQLVWVLL